MRQVGTYGLFAASALALLAAIHLPLRPSAWLVHPPLTEDGFFALGAARSLAETGRMSIDGTTLTNGVQPLYVVLMVPCFLLAKGADALRLVLGAHWLLLLGQLALLRAVMSRLLGNGDPDVKLAGALAPALLMASAPMLPHQFNGLETGLLWLVLLLCWRTFADLRPGRAMDEVRLGAVAGLLVLARIDQGFLVVFLAVALFFLSEEPAFRRLLGPLRMGATAALVSAPWWAYNVLAFGHVVPSSGRAQQQVLLSSERIGAMLASLSWTSAPMLYLGRFESPATFALRLLLAVGAVYLVVRRGPSAKTGDEPRAPSPQRRQALVFGACLLASGVLLGGWYALASYAVWFYQRYLSFLALPALLLGAAALARLLSKRTALQVATAIVCAALGLAGVLHLSTDLSTMTPLASVYVDRQVALAQAHVPPGERVAAGQTGTLSFVRGNALNLDGKVNDEALRYKGQLTALLDKYQINWYCDIQWFIDRDFGGSLEDKGWTKVAQRGDFTLYHRDQAPTAAPPHTPPRP